MKGSWGSLFSHSRPLRLVQSFTNDSLRLFMYYFSVPNHSIDEHADTIEMSHVQPLPDLYRADYDYRIDEFYKSQRCERAFCHTFHVCRNLHVTVGSYCK